MSAHILNPDEMLICPYDSSHRVQALRFHIHLVRCKKAHPELDRLMEICPFNALHRFVSSEREKHLSECVDRYKIFGKSEKRGEKDAVVKGNVSVPLYTRRKDEIMRNDDDEDDWDKEE